MTTDLRAALRDLCEAIEGNRATSSDRIAAYRALSDAPPTVAELLPLVDATHEVHASRGDVAIRFRLHRSARVPMPPVDAIAAERHHQGLWWPTRMLPADLTRPARLVEVT